MHEPHHSRRLIPWHIPLAVCLALSQANADVFQWNFEDVDAETAPVNVLDLTHQFFERNIPVVGWQIGTSLDVYDARHSFAGHILTTDDEHNVLMLSAPCPTGVCPDGVRQFLFIFSRPVVSFSVTRAALNGSTSEAFVHPAWSMVAYDPAYLPVGANGEEPIIATGPVDKRTLTVVAPAIQCIVFSMNSEAASVPGVILDSFRMLTGGVPACDPDVNCDGSADGFDIQTMERAAGGDTSDFCQPSADFNRDGSVDGFDVEAVESVVGGGPCP